MLREQRLIKNLKKQNGAQFQSQRQSKMRYSRRNIIKGRIYKEKLILKKLFLRKLSILVREKAKIIFEVFKNHTLKCMVYYGF